MRPVTRGDAPQGAKTYEEMRPTLIDERLGRHCSYCEFPVKHVPHAEYVIPKDRFPAWRDRWDNQSLIDKLGRGASWAADQDSKADLHDGRRRKNRKDARGARAR
jgi:hypothetical protein